MAEGRTMRLTARSVKVSIRKELRKNGGKYIEVSGLNNVGWYYRAGKA